MIRSAAVSYFEVQSIFIDKQVVAWCDSVEIEIDFCGFECVIGSFTAGVRGDH